VDGCQKLLLVLIGKIETDLVLMISLNDTVADERPLTPQWEVTPVDGSPRLRRDVPDGLNDTSACTSSL